MTGAAVLEPERRKSSAKRLVGTRNALQSATGRLLSPNFDPQMNSCFRPFE